MKTLTRLLFGLWLLPLAATAGDGQVMEIGVTGMVCAFCSAKVEKELKTLPGVKEVSVDLDNKRARIVMADGQSADAAAVCKIIADAGFTPVELDASKGM